VAFRNKRNYRIWNDATFENCIAGYPLKRGGSGGTANFGVYSNAVIRINRCTLVGEGAQISLELGAEAKKGPPKTHAIVRDSLVVFPGEAVMAENPRIRITNTSVLSLADPAGRPVFRGKAGAEWNGLGDAFDPAPGHANRGFRRSGAR